MLGRSSPQGELFRADNVYLEHVGKDSIYGFLAQARLRIFRDADFAGLFGKTGRPSVPPSQLCVALLLQARDGVSDDEAIQRTAFDLRWKVALGLNLDEKLCAKSTLQEFRAKLILHDAYQKLFQASVDECRRSGLLRKKRLEVAIDSTPVLGAGAVRDTFNLISDQIRRVLVEISKLKGGDATDLAKANDLSQHFGASFKGESDIDWTDESQQRALVGSLVADAKKATALAQRSMLGHARGAERTKGLREARALLADLLLQDIDEDPDDGGGPGIRRGTARDRKVSTTDPEMRHGHKTVQKHFQGYKASVVADTTDGVVLATCVAPGNEPDKVCAQDLVAKAAEHSEQKITRVIGDTAYGSMETRQALRDDGVEVVAKMPPVINPKQRFTIADFRIDEARGVARCPNGKRSVRRHRQPGIWQYVFADTDCATCPLREQCTSAKRSRSITVADDFRERERLRRFQGTREFRRVYRRRVVIEHRIARLVQLGIRKARYFGKAKVAFQVAIAAAMANLTLANARKLLLSIESIWLDRIQPAPSAIRLSISEQPLPDAHSSRRRAA
jgi:transposase